MDNATNELSAKSLFHMMVSRLKRTTLSLQHGELRSGISCLQLSVIWVYLDWVNGVFFARFQDLLPPGLIPRIGRTLFNLGFRDPYHNGPLSLRDRFLVETLIICSGGMDSVVAATGLEDRWL